MMSRDLGTEHNDVGGIRGFPEQVSPASTNALAQINREFKLSLNLYGFDYSFEFLIELRERLAKGPGNQIRSDISFDPGIYAMACQNHCRFEPNTNINPRCPLGDCSGLAMLTKSISMLPSHSRAVGSQRNSKRDKG